jgi:peptidoglycan hydrolase CwlO-like protein
MLRRVDLMAAADELYSLRPEEFVPRRTSLAAEAKDGGDKSLAAEIKKLVKPTTAAWVVNMLVRHEPDQVEQVLGLGAALREAQASMAGDELRQLGRQRRQLTAAVTREARALAAELGQKIGDPVATQVEDTLHAAMVDEDAAKAVRTGLLVKPLAVAGTEAADVVESVAVAAAMGETAVRRAPAPRPGKKAPEPQKPELTVVEDNSRAIADAEAELAEAEGELAAAERRLAKTARKVEKREAKGLQLQGELEELRRKVAELEQRIGDNEDELSDAEDVRDEREEDVEEARAAVERARKALDALR